MSLKKRKPDFQNPAFVLRLKFLFIDNLDCLMIGFNDVYSCGEKAYIYDWFLCGYNLVSYTVKHYNRGCQFACDIEYFLFDITGRYCII